MADEVGRKPTLARRLDQFYRFSLREPLLSRWRGFRHRNMPIAMVTGTAGKTTTTRLTAAILEAAGHRVAVATTDGVTVGGTIIGIGDFAGHTGHKIAMADRSATAAVLETARGGILRWGFFIRPVTASALLNVRSEHVGTDGIPTLAAMVRLKSRVTDNGRRVILNAAQPEVVALVSRYGPRRVTLFGGPAEAERLDDHVAKGGRAVMVDPDGILVFKQPGRMPRAVSDTKAWAFAWDRRASHYVSNGLAAAALAWAMGAPDEAIRHGLETFSGGTQGNPGRLNHLTGYDLTLMVTRGIHPGSLEADVAAFHALTPGKRRILVMSAIGNRPDAQLEQAAALVAGKFDTYIFREVEDWRRGRVPGELAGLFRAALMRRGVPDGALTIAEDDAAAFRIASDIAGPGDGVFIGGKWHVSGPAVEAAFERWKTG